MTIKIKLLGHASFMVKTNDKVLFLDPFGGKENDYKEKADIILITHEHRDHSDPGKINLIQDENTIVVTSTQNAKNLSGNIKALKPGQMIEIDEVKIHGVDGYNVRRFRAPNEPFHPKGIQTAYVIEIEGKRIYFAGDTDFIEEMKQLANIDVAMLPMDGKYTMDLEEAMDAVGVIKPKMVIPMHWRENDPKKFKTEVEAKYPETKVTVIQEGEEIIL